MRQNPLSVMFREVALKRGHFKLASGKESSYYIDKTAVTLDSAGLSLVSHGMWEIIKGMSYEFGQPFRPCTAVGGLTLGADPIVGGILMVAHSRGRGQHLKGFIVRKDRKEHGTGQWIEGSLSSADSVVIVEDVVTTGGSALVAIERVREVGARVLGVVAAVDRQEGAAEAFAKAGVSFESLVTIDQILA